MLVRPFRIFPVDAFLHQLIHSLMEVCQEHGYRLLVETASARSSPGTYATMVRAKQIDGLVVLGVYEEDPGLTALIASGYPVVLLGHHPGPDARVVVSEEEAGFFLATSHLIALGHRRLAFINFTPLREVARDARLRACPGIRRSPLCPGPGARERLQCRQRLRVDAADAIAWPTSDRPGCRE